MANKTAVADVVLRDTCDGLRQEMAAEYRYLHDAARNLRASLAAHGRVRAWLVARYLHLAAECSKHASAHAIATYFAFRRHFEPELQGIHRTAITRTRTVKTTSSFTFGSGGDR